MPRFSFAQLGDPQFGLGSDGLEMDTTRFQFALRQCVQRQCEFAVSVGDLTHNALEEESDAYRKAVDAELAGPDGELRMDLHNVAGNHDMQSAAGHDSYLSHFCRAPYASRKSYYTFERDNIFFVIINTMILMSSVSDLQEERKAHWTWLRAALSPDSVKRFSGVIVFGHHPLFVLHEDESDTSETTVPDAILKGERRKWMTNLPAVGSAGGREIVERAVKDMSMISMPTKERQELISLFKQAGVKQYLFGHTHNRIEVPCTDLSFVQYSATGTSMSLDFPEYPLNLRIWTVDTVSSPPTVSNELVFLPVDICPPLIPNEEIEKMGARPIPPDGRKVKPGREFLERIEERRKEIMG